MMVDLTDQQREVLRRQLLAMRVALQERSQAARENARPVSPDPAIGRLTRMDAIQQQQMALGQQINTALRRLGQDRYGLCLRCHEAIGFERLKARPTTTLCRECQEGLENTPRKR
jgi:DnaK suppressor protein